MSRWTMAAAVGYTPITTFWDDFSIAEPFGRQAIEDTAKRAFDEWKDNYKYLTELIMVINHKSWEHAEHNNSALAELYSNLYYRYDEKAIKYISIHHPESALTYYFKTLD